MPGRGASRGIEERRVLIERALARWTYRCRFGIDWPIPENEDSD